MAIVARSLPTADDELFLGQLVFVDQPPVRLRFFDRIQVVALDVLDERDLQQMIVVDLAHDDGDLEQARALRRAPAALAGDDLEAALDAADEQRLNHAVRANRLRELFEPRFVDVRARLARIGHEQIEIDLRRPLGIALDDDGLRARGLGDERAQAAAERRAFLSHGSLLSPDAGAGAAICSAAARSRARNSCASAMYASAPRDRAS